MSWFSATLETKVTIDAPPERVREVFLDFEHLHQWHTDFIKSTMVTRRASEEAISGIQAEPGDILTIDAGGFVGVAEVLENDANVFSYAHTARKLGLDATRTFRFTPESSGRAGSRTLFTQFATWEGYAAIMFWAWSPIRLHVKWLFEGFQDDLKKAAEEKSD